MSEQLVVFAPHELEPLLAPIAPESATGESLRFDPLFDEIRRLREEDDAALPQGVWQRELKRADWSAVARLSAEVLTAKTKDLQVAAWLTEAWLHQRGLAGLEAGLRLLAALCDRFWDDIHPHIEEGSLAPRLAPIVWAFDKLVLPLKSVHVTAPNGSDAEPYGWKDWETGQYLGNLTKKNAAAAADAEKRGMVPQSKFMVSVSLTPGAWFVGLTHEAGAALAALDELDQVLIARCGPAEAPSVTALRAPLSAIQSFASRLVGERVEKGEIVSNSELPDADGIASASEAIIPISAAPHGGTGAITSRAEAYARLREASEYLLRTEPHSPVPYLIRRAIAWGNMSLAELLEELLQKGTDIATINTLLGIRKS
jgi:type VI secretion system ImpA family protein